MRKADVKHVKTIAVRVAKLEGLTGVKARKFKAFMPKAFPHEMGIGYTWQWAHRFKAGYAYASADSERRKVLSKLGVTGKSVGGVMRDVYKTRGRRK